MDTDNIITSIEPTTATSIRLHITSFKNLLTIIFSHSRKIALYSHEQKLITKKLIEMDKIFDLETTSDKTQEILDNEGNINTKVLDQKIADSITVQTKFLNNKINQIKQSSSKNNNNTKKKNYNNNTSHSKGKGAINNGATTKKSTKKVQIISALKKNPKYSRGDNNKDTKKENKKKKEKNKNNYNKRSPTNNSSRLRK